jgi:UDP-GlcNAc:undecaprenyl-phosphate/decaprenyl-phosphate GlcNAc-1-phosphate transferase
VSVVDLLWVVTGLVAGGVLAALGLRWLSNGVLSHPSLVRTNHRGADVVIGSGLVYPLVGLASFAVLRLLLAIWPEFFVGQFELLPLVAFTAVAFGVLGLVDDLIGDVGPKGFRGHLGAMRHGRLTTGALKLFGGAVAGVALAPVAHDAHEWSAAVALLRGGAVVALSANLLNLFDRAPGRTIKVGVLWALLLVPFLEASTNATLLVMVGVSLALLVPDLGERTMLGDTGANALGAVLGVVTCVAAGAVAEWVVLAVLVAMTMASERVSFSRVIDRTPPLRWLDRLGRRPF